MMTQNSINKLLIPKEYFRIASRFMKEVGLYYYWMQFLNDKTAKKNWFNETEDYNITSVFGCTHITSYLEKRGIKLPHDVYLYEVFVDYLREMHPNLLKTIDDDSIKFTCTNLLKVDKEKKKVTLIFS